MATNLPTSDTNSKDSASKVKTFFDRYFTESISYPANEVDAVIGFFKKRGFDDSAAISVSVVLLQQSKIDNVKIFKLLDTLKGLSDIEISSVVAEILNYSRSKVSTLGYKIDAPVEAVDKRNIAV
jgi:hypothetical protein